MQDDLSKELNQLTEQINSLREKVIQLEGRNKDQLSIALVSGDLDKILAMMVIALAAAAQDTRVKLFFSFWSLSALRDKKKTAKGKNFISSMFGLLLPAGKSRLRLSKMNMAGIGPMMINYLMKKQGVLSIEQMFKEAADLGIEITVCEMSMNLMGFKKEEMIDYPYLRFAGATTFVAEANESSIQLFI
jgi:peroxiredoxin family protein